MTPDGGSWAPFGPGDGDDDERPRDDPPQDEERHYEPPAPPPATPLAWPAASAEPEPEPAPPPPAPVPPVHQWNGPAPAPYGTSVARTSGNATAALVLGIVGIFMCPLVASIPAIALGGSAKREIQANPGMGGWGMATWGVALGWVGTVWGGILLLIFLLSTFVTVN